MSATPAKRFCAYLFRLFHSALIFIVDDGLMAGAVSTVLLAAGGDLLNSLALISALLTSLNQSNAPTRTSGAIGLVILILMLLVGSSEHPGSCT